jgi:monovalent cation/hydrogen antiporter
MKNRGSWRGTLVVVFAIGAGWIDYMGVVAHLVESSLPWAACFALGAIVSPPDAVAAKAVLQGLSLPPRRDIAAQAWEMK